MAHIHKSQLTPSKTEVIASWLVRRPWFDGDPTGPVDKVAAFRFDDPEGRVGVEFLLVRAGTGPILQVPLTYRDAPLDGAAAGLLGTLEHSVLGTRYVYDGMADPAALAALATAALTGGVQADEFYEIDGVRAYREPTASVAGSGAAGSPMAAPSVAEVATRDSASAPVTVSTFGSVVVALSRVPGLPASELAASLGEAAAATREVLSGTWTGHAEPVTLAAVARTAS